MLPTPTWSKFISLSKPILRGFEKCKIPSNLWNRRCLCQTPGISAWGSLEDSRWTWHREQSWIPGSQYDHPARQSNYVTFNISSMFFLQNICKGIFYHILWLSPRLYHTFGICDAQAFLYLSQGSIPKKEKD